MSVGSIQLPSLFPSSFPAESGISVTATCKSIDVESMLVSEKRYQRMCDREDSYLYDDTLDCGFSPFILQNQVAHQMAPKVDTQSHNLAYYTLFRILLRIVPSEIANAILADYLANELFRLVLDLSQFYQSHSGSVANGILNIPIYKLWRHFDEVDFGDNTHLYKRTCKSRRMNGDIDINEDDFLDVIPVPDLVATELAQSRLELVERISGAVIRFAVYIEPETERKDGIPLLGEKDSDEVISDTIHLPLQLFVETFGKDIEGMDYWLIPDDLTCQWKPGYNDLSVWLRRKERRE